MSPDPAGAALLALVGAAGGRVDGLVVAARGGERGVFATRGFAEGDAVLAVPPELLVPSPALAATPLGALVEGWDGDEHPVLLAAWLTTALGRSGAAGAYTATLPTDLGHLPVHYDDARRAALAGTAFLDRVEARRARLLHEHDGLARHLDVPAEAWLRARSLVTSRSFSCAGGEALVPLGDLLNHALDPGTAWTCDATDGFVVRATRPLPPGEVFVSYGAKSNARLLLAYGFTLEENPEDDLELHLGELGAFRLTASVDTFEAERLLRALGAEPGRGSEGRARALAAFARLCRGRLARIPDDTPAERADPALRGVLAVRASERRILGFWAAE